MHPTKQSVLLFAGKAEEAIRFYVSLFPNSKITEIIYLKNEADIKSNKIKKAHFSLNGREFIGTDQKVECQIGSLPPCSIPIHCESKIALFELFDVLSRGGKILMPIKKEKADILSGQIEDKFGMLWLLTALSDENINSESNVCFANSPEVRPEYRY